MKQCYYEIPFKSVIASQALDVACDSSKWYDYYNFKAKPLSPEIVLQDELFKYLSNKYNFIVGVLKLDPYVCYNWHIDTRRGVGINMLLTPQLRSITTFAPYGVEVEFPIQELKYKPNTYYIFNTQVPHSVINFEVTRYLLSVEFEKNRDELTFEDLMNDIKDNYEKNRTE